MYCKAPGLTCTNCARVVPLPIMPPVSFPRVPEDAASEMLAVLNRSLARQYRQMADLYEQLAIEFDKQAVADRKPLASLPAPVMTN